MDINIGAGTSSIWKHLAWTIAIWLASVAVVGLIAAIIRF
ncbi:DUF2474 domain-containing protein [Ochrobactrum sp. POC9]|nr:DUF2474 domain-containing protein [Ochrobactrum sp. POC9]PWU70698.1 DUF2474 domain-containing protein [Ochrobactrum sp. POC9]